MLALSSEIPLLSAPVIPRRYYVTTVGRSIPTLFGALEQSLQLCCNAHGIGSHFPDDSAVSPKLGARGASCAVQPFF